MKNFICFLTIFIFGFSCFKEIMSSILVDIDNYVLQKRAEWVTEGSLTDSNWSEYIDKLNKMGLKEIIEIKQAAFERADLELSEF